MSKFYVGDEIKFDQFVGEVVRDYIDGCMIIACEGAFAVAYQHDKTNWCFVDEDYEFTDFNAALDNAIKFRQGLH